MQVTKNESLNLPVYTEKIWQPSEDDVPEEITKNGPTFAKIKNPPQIDSAIQKLNKTSAA